MACRAALTMTRAPDGHAQAVAAHCLFLGVTEDQVRDGAVLFR